MIGARQRVRSAKSSIFPLTVIVKLFKKIEDSVRYITNEHGPKV